MRTDGRAPRAVAFSAAWLLIALSARSARAQEDFRSLDSGRPLRISDAYPVRFLEWEIQLGLRGSLAEASRGAAATVELETGLWRNFELGLEVEPAIDRSGGRSRSGVEGLATHMLYNLNQESWTWPAFSFRLGAEAPIGGSLGRNDWGIEATGIATRTFASRIRLHLNAGYATSSTIDGGDFWAGGMAFDAPIGLFSRLLAGDVFVEVPVDRGRTRVYTELGVRMQISNLSVLDFGVGTRLDEWADGTSNVQLVVGISRVFSLGGLISVPRFPNPRIQ